MTPIMTLIEAFGWTLTFTNFMDSLLAVLVALAVYFLKRILDNINDMSKKVLVHEEKHKTTEIRLEKVEEKVADHDVKIARLEV